MRAAELLPDAVRRLAAAGVADPTRDARRLLAFALGVSQERLILHLHDPVEDTGITKFNAAIDERARRRPLSQIIGERLFWGRSFQVTRDVLDPRPETETLVECALAEPFDTVLDLGTGSGAILLTLLAERPEAMGMGVDVSPAALAVARNNASRLGLLAEFILSDWFSDVGAQFDLIVSNPPYITAAEMPALDPEVRDWEPHLALTPGGDGLDAYRRIARGASAHLKLGGRVMVEIGPTQGRDVTQLFRDEGFQSVDIAPDMDGRDRVVRAR
ncbi:peptide chain release factor N(5)-glutamine methyltransferase [Haematobacter missouriensis]|uniref:Release factor glutamine methyltransferase n=1 Tax=Haematobacter missouriensis TaxID=366616 RepID=A0A225CVR5_9RHOB|nr:peptide chain release factor N(5)-glutamine methyltransferase [Haematobacter missouriensis]OWJ78309.1 protein-(glutamine-N5) methyltransferase, release factor-specific [Haematobacter missouriensis]OWJ86058.1 protein-(glutamine-N5) methyltransferase, release factor-specific [Haematobacter missouriensis]